MRNQTTIDQIGKRYRFVTKLPIVGDYYGLFFTKYELDTKHIAKRIYEVTGDEPILELCCGIGASTVFLAKLFSKVYAVDNDKSRLEFGIRNSSTFNVSDNITFLNIDALSSDFYEYFKEIRIKAVIIDPEWRLDNSSSTPSDSNPTVFNIADTHPSISQIYPIVKEYLTENIVIKLPPTISLDQVEKIDKCEIERVIVGGVLKYYNIYFGSLYKINKSEFIIQ